MPSLLLPVLIRIQEAARGTEKWHLDCRGLGLAEHWSQSYDMEFPLRASVGTDVAVSSAEINRGN
jgi:hypothetical protein